MSDIIQLMEDAVVHLIPSYANEDDMYKALDKCALTEDQIFDELNRRLGSHAQQMRAEELAPVIVDILYSSFNRALLTATAHKVAF